MTQTFAPPQISLETTEPIQIVSYSLAFDAQTNKGTIEVVYQVVQGGYGGTVGMPASHNEKMPSFYKQK